MDISVEQLTREKRGRKDYAIAAGTGTLRIVILATNTLITFLGPFLLIIVAGVFIGIYYVSASRNLEHEYNTTSEDFTVDQITNRRNRRRTYSFDLKTVEGMEQYNTLAFQNRSFARQLIVGEDDEGTDAWYLIAHLKDSDNTLLVFSPNERVLTAIKPFLPRQISVDAFRGS